MRARDCRSLRLISRRLISHHSFVFLLLLLAIVVVKDLQIFHLIPNADINDCAEGAEESCREVEKVSECLGVVEPAVAGAAASLAPHQAGSEEWKSITKWFQGFQGFQGRFTILVQF